MIKKIERLEYEEADSITDPISRSFLIGNSFIRLKEKLNEIIDAINKLNKEK